MVLIRCQFIWIIRIGFVALWLNFGEDTFCYLHWPTSRGCAKWTELKLKVFLYLFFTAWSRIICWIWWIQRPTRFIWMKLSNIKCFQFWNCKSFSFLSSQKWTKWRNQTEIPKLEKISNIFNSFFFLHRTNESEWSLLTKNCFIFISF